MAWSEKYKKSIDCQNPKGFSQKSHCQGRKKNLEEEGLRDWFGKSKSKDGKPGWVNVVTGGTCASDEPGEGTPKCVSSAKRASMTKAERLSASRRKKKLDPGQQEKSGAAKPTYVSTDKAKKKMKEELDLQEVKDKPGKGSGKKDACYHKVKSRYDVWPSAYASGALSKCRKVGADNWGTKSEEVEMQRYCPRCQKNETRDVCKYGPKYWDMFSTPITLSSDAYDPNGPHPTNEEKDHEYSMARSEISTIISAAKRLKNKMGKGEGSLEAWVQSKITKAADYLDTAADYVDSGEMKAESVSNEPKLKPGSGLGGGKPTYPHGKQPKPTGAKLFPLAKGEGGSPYEPYNKPKGPSQPTQPPGGFDKFREKYGIPKKPSLQMTHFVPENDLVDEQVAGTESMADKYKDFDVTVKKIRERQKKGKLTSSELIGSLRRASQVRPVDENLTLQDLDNNDFVEIIDIIKPEKIKGAVSEKCWDGYEQIGMKKKGKKIVPNCVKKEEYSNWREDFSLKNSEDEFINENIIKAAKLAAKVIKSVGKPKVRKSLPPIKLKNLSPERRKEVMYQAQKKIKSYKPGEIDKVASRKYAADRLNTVYGRRQDVLSRGGSPKESAAQSISSMGPNDPLGKDFNIKRGGRGRRGAHGPGTDRGKGNAAKRRAGQEVLDTGDKKVHYRPTRSRSIQQSRERRAMRRMERRLNRIIQDEFSNWREDFGISEQSAHGPQIGGWKIGQPVGQHLAKKSPKQKIKDSGSKYGKKAFEKNLSSDFNEDWQSVNRKDKTDGLSQKAVDAYRRENPGSKLKTAVTEKNPTGKRAERRKSFCRRMSGMKKRLTSAETARDPDSRINKALRRWNCN